jgi:hypothetical protein
MEAIPVLDLERFRQIEFENNNHCSDCEYRDKNQACLVDADNCPVVCDILYKVIIPLSEGTNESLANDFISWILDNEGFIFSDSPAQFVKNNLNKLSTHLLEYIDFALENGGLKNRLPIG